jgi:transcriptional regulator with PAS, ATPase and Fis domain
MTEPTPAAREPALPTGPSDVHRPHSFRWQAFFQRSTDALFVLDSQRRLRFVNRAWEALTGLSSTSVRLLSCKRHRPAAAEESLVEVLAHVLAPTPEVAGGAPGRVRRRLPAGDALGRHWWDIDFLPLQSDTKAVAILGRIHPVDEAVAPLTPLPEKLIELRERTARFFDFSLLESCVPSVRRLGEQVRLAATMTAPVLLTGEAGTGKESLARLIHYQSAARERAFAAIDCTRLPAPALTELLFTERGEIPGRPGVLYLREPSRLPRELQVRVADLVAAESGVRLMAGCRGSPAQEVRAGRLVAALYSVFPLAFELPALRDRTADLPALVRSVLGRLSAGDRPRISGLSIETQEVFRQYAWPGNLRELFNLLAHSQKRASGSLLELADLPAPIRLIHAAGPAPAPDRSLPLDKLLEQAERRLIELALRRTKGHRGRAAEMLGIWRARLLRRIEALGIGGAESPDPGE